MTVLERLKAAGYDPAVSLFPDSIGNAGSMECERIQIRTFFCRPRENEAAIGVTATAMTHFSDGSTRPYPDGWPRSLEASVTLYFAGDAEFHYFGNVATDLVGSDAEFRYRLLSRCIQDCKYFLGCLGNGVTVCNSAVMENGDFKMVAHISNEGKITWYVGEDYPPADALASIRACAEQERAKYETWLNGLSPAARREYQLERLPPPEFLEELRKAKEEKGGA